jgi:outer membrane protein TolC
VSFTEDPVLRELVRQALEARPELKQGRALIEAERARIPQSRILPDPVITLGIQNDGFTSIQIGKMETSWATVMASQAFPWFGKRDLRAGVVEAQVDRAEVDLNRATLAVTAEVERAYLDLLEVREQVQLLGRMDALWSQSEGISRSRYETAGGTQSDLLRAQLARSRLRQRRVLVVAEESRRLLVLNRLRGQSPSALLSPGLSLADLADPRLGELTDAIANAQQRSPELRRARVQGEQAKRQISLTRRDPYPDVIVTAAVMPRGGSFETMWQAGVSLTVPVWSLSRRDHALREGRARVSAAEANVEGIRCLLEQRVRERHALLAALLDSLHIFRSGLLVQSEATVASTLAQYRVGRVDITPLLDAMAGYVTDVNGFLESVVQAQRLEIAERELSLDDAGGNLPGLPGGAGMATPAGPATGSAADAARGGGGDAEVRAGSGAAMSKM